MKLVHTHMFRSLLNSFECMPRNELLGHIVVSCLVFWKINTIFYSSFTILHSPQQCRRVPISLYPCHLFSFLLNTHFIGIKWYLIVVMICIFLMTDDIEHLFMYLFSNGMSFLENYFQSSIRFHSNCFLTLELYEFFILNINPLSEVIIILKHLIWLNHIKYHIVKTIIKNCQFYNIQLYIST